MFLYLLDLFAYGIFYLFTGSFTILICLIPFAIIYGILASGIGQIAEGIEFLIEDVKDNLKKN